MGTLTRGAVTPPEAARKAWGDAALALERALYEDQTRRRHDPAAKARYDANLRAKKAARKALHDAVRTRCGKILDELPGLPRVPAPRR